MGFSAAFPYLLLAILLALTIYDLDTFVQLFAYDSSPIDWCEENYKHSKFIAELFNTLSSFAMVVCAAVGKFVYAEPRFQKFEPAFQVVWALFAFIGLGSILFHGTLSVAGQILDEVPIVLTTVGSLSIVVPKRRWRPSIRARLFEQRPISVFSFVLVIVLACLRFPVVSHIITISCIPVVLGTFFKELYDFRQRSHITPDKRTRDAWRNASRLFAIAFAFFLMAWIAWLLDRVYCEPVTAFFQRNLGFSLELHAWWHILSSIMFWFLLASGIVVRTSGDGVDTRLSYHSGFPAVKLV